MTKTDKIKKKHIRRFMDVVKEDKKMVGVTEKEVRGKGQGEMKEADDSLWQLV